ncbi:MAG TPA: acetyl-CoA C-acyltransferase, partial [Woeseiaceae bacterium]|nr:acetyl-CoA C-acyltransferase [Woeseiaceae bacterium]
MSGVVILSTARTALTKSVRGAFNNTHGITLASHALANAIDRAGVSPEEIEDVIMGCAYPEGATGFNIGRNAAMAAGCPRSTAGATINRYCSSGLQAIAMAAGRVMNEGVPIAAAGGVEQISMVQMGKDVNLSNMTEKELFKRMPALWMTMIETAEIVADRYQVSRESQDEFALLSQQRTAAAQKAGLFADEIVPLKATWKKVDRETKEVSYEEVVADRDDCNRPDTTLEGLASLKPVFKDGQQVKEGKYVTAGNASQFSDGASACVVMSETDAEKRGLEPLGAFRGFAASGCNPDEMGIGPVFAVPRLLERNGDRKSV